MLAVGFSSCPPDGILGDADLCYQVSDTALSWSDSLKACEKLGGDLIMLTDHTERSFLLPMLDERYLLKIMRK